MSSISKAAYCVVCEKAVGDKDQALECDRCRRWVHRQCGTGMSLKEYRAWNRHVKKGGKFSWECGHCSDPASSVSCVSVAVDAAGDFQDDELHVSRPLMESTRLDPSTASSARRQ